jgi:SAM-dependent methyltransferase
MDDPDYTDRLIRLQSQPWKQKLGFANPYGIHIRRILAGSTLEVGCGIGRVLNFAPQDMVGVDLNAKSVQVCRDRGLQAYCPDEFFAHFKGRNPFSTLLLSHVVEHMTVGDAVGLVQSYKPHLTNNARLVLITPQEKGFASDATHVEFMDYPKLAAICKESGFEVEKSYSFPFVRALGKAFIYNEFVSIGRRV